MATLAQLEEGIRRANAKGDINAVRKLGEAYRSMQSAQNFSTALPENWKVGNLQQEPEAQPNPLQRFGQSMYSTVTGGLQGATMGAYDELASVVGTPIKAVENLVTGRDTVSGPGDIGPFLGRSLMSAREGQSGLDQMAFDQAPAAYIAGDLAGSLGTGLGLAGRGGTLFGKIARPTIVGMAGRGALEGGATGAGAGYAGAPEDTTQSRLQSALVGGLAGAGLGGISGGVMGGLGGKLQSAAVPTGKALMSEAGDLYEAGKLSRVVATPQQSSDISNRVGSIAVRENVILPNGKFNSAYKPLEGILDTLDAYAGRPVNVGEIQKIRDTIRDVVANPEPGVQRIALDMLDEFNDYAYSVYPDLAKADDLYWRGKTGELIDKMGKLATSRSGQYTQSGMENALRAEFRALERQIIKGRVKGLPPELIEQVSKVAQGDNLQDAARWLSRFGMRNPMTMAGGTAAGFATGSLPVAATIWGAGQLAGMGAEALAKEKYRLASALARSGGNLPAWQYGPGAGAIVQGGSSALARALQGGGGQ